MRSPIGRLRMFSNGEELTGIYFEDHAPQPKQTAGKVDLCPFREVQHQLDQYFAGERHVFTLSIQFSGTAFQEAVWRRLCTIPMGETTTYGDLAIACDKPQAARAIGAAVGRNPISIVVPCHRVIGSRGSLTGFAGGIERKRWLLALEGVAPSRSHLRSGVSDTAGA